MEEQRAWRESVALLDLSYHMADLEIKGPDALELLSEYSANGYDNARVGRAKQLVVANPHGEFIGDGILFQLEDDEFLGVGPAAGLNWLEYQAEVGDYDVTTESRGRPVATEDDPKYFRYQIQGPDALDVAQKISEEELPDIGFFNFEELTVEGHAVNFLRHGMAGEPGFELFGPYEYSDTIVDAILDAGEEYDIRRVGSRSYKVTPVLSGWFPLPVPAIYTSDEMEDYREWLSAKRGILSIGGSFESEEISDYYVTPVELGYDRFIDLDHDFVGKEAIAEEIENPDRTKVTLVWDREDISKINNSLYNEGDHYKNIEMPVARWSACQYDEIRKDGETVGVANWNSYSYNEREMLSVSVIDVEHSEPGTEVTLIWDEPEWSDNPEVERHDQTEISATVQPAPYIEDRR
jgi:glycine cleavage system aminomethyltransferase T